jgi:deoxyribodipyrimidine photo-lyase
MADDNANQDISRPVIVWFRDDLRLGDNPALNAAAQSGRPVYCIYVDDEESEGLRPLGGASRWWLHGSLQELDDALRRRGGRLFIHRGQASTVIPRLAAMINAAAAFWNRRYGAAERAIDETVKTALKAQKVEARSFNGHLLYEPWSVKTKTGGSFRVFSAFWRAAHQVGDPELPLRAPSRLEFFDGSHSDGLSCLALADLRLEPSSPDWAGGLRANWKHGEAGAEVQLEKFLNEHLGKYADFRDCPGRPDTSRLSPYLRFGNISAREVWHASAAATNAASHRTGNRNLEKFQSELGWREFSYHLLYHNPALASQNLQPRFDAMPWKEDPKAFRAWQTGTTGYPIVDAGMRELWNTGWMHNRVRMVAASFLIKHLLIDWRHGESWFWDTLVDADPANNAASWQWVAGSGADAAPYFRIFNPTLQGQKFDPGGDYVRRWIPELDEFPASAIHRPRQAPDKASGRNPKTGVAYPAPVVDHDEARRRALKAYDDLA